MSRFRWSVFAVCALCVGVMTATARAEDSLPDDDSERRETWFAEFGAGASAMTDDRYVRRLHDFGFETEDWLFGDRVAVGAQAIGYMLHANYGVLLRHEGLEHRELTRWNEAESESDYYRWDSRAMTVGARGRLPIFRDWFAFYGQLDVGLGFARTRYKNVGQESHVEREFGPAFGFLGGFAANFFKYGGAYLEAGYTHARILENNFGDKHQDGGVSLIFGLRVRGLQGV